MFIIFKNKSQKMQQYISKLLKISTLSVLIGFLSVNTLFAQLPASTVAKSNAQSQAPNLIIITTDGFRWQEVFGGMDTSLAKNKMFNQGDSAYISVSYTHLTLPTNREV